MKSPNTPEFPFTRPSVPSMKDVFRVAQRIAIVKHCLESWELGEMSLERALICAVAFLADENERLLERATIDFTKDVRMPTIPELVSLANR